MLSLWKLRSLHNTNRLSLSSCPSIAEYQATKHMSLQDFSHSDHDKWDFPNELEAAQGYKVILTDFKDGKTLTSDLANASIFPANNSFISRMSRGWGHSSLGKVLFTNMSSVPMVVHLESQDRGSRDRRVLEVLTCQSSRASSSVREPA